MTRSLWQLHLSGQVSAAVARTFASDPASLDGVTVRANDFDAESWTHFAVEQQLKEWGS